MQIHHEYVLTSTNCGCQQRTMTSASVSAACWAADSLSLMSSSSKRFWLTSRSSRFTLTQRYISSHTVQMIMRQALGLVSQALLNPPWMCDHYYFRGYDLTAVLKCVYECLFTFLNTEQLSHNATDNGYKPPHHNPPFQPPRTSRPDRFFWTSLFCF